MSLSESYRRHKVSLDPPSSFSNWSSKFWLTLNTKLHSPKPAWSWARAGSIAENSSSGLCKCKKRGNLGLSCSLPLNYHLLSFSPQSSLNLISSQASAPASPVDDLQPALFMCLASVGDREICFLLVWSIFLLLKPLNELKVIFPAVCTGRNRFLSISSTATAALYQVAALHNHESGVQRFKCTWSDGVAWLCDLSYPCLLVCFMSKAQLFLLH